MNGTLKSSKHYDHCVIAFAQQMPGDRKNQNSLVYVIAPDVTVLTKSRKLSIGRTLWQLAGNSLRVWDDEATDDQRIGWCNSRMGRYTGVRMTVDLLNETIDWDTDTTNGDSHSFENVFIDYRFTTVR